MKLKNIKKIVAVICTTALIASCAACGNTSKEESDVIKIGVMQDLSGDNATYGLSIVPGMQLAVDEINENGGVLGKKLELDITDTQSDTNVSQQMAKKLINSDKVDVLMGNVTSAAREAVRPIVDDAEKLYFYTQEYEGGVADHFTFCTSPLCGEQMVIPAMEEVGKDIENCKVFIIVPDYNFGQIIEKYIEEETEKLNGTVVGVEYVPLGVSNFSSTIANITAANPDMVVACPVGSAQTSFFEQWHSEGIADIPVVTHMACVSTYEHKVFDKGVMDNVYVCASYCEELDSDLAKEYTEKIKPLLAKNDIPYCNEQSEYGYVTVNLYAKALEAAGTTDTEKVIEALETGDISFDAPSGTVSVRGEDHQTIRNMTLFKCDANNTLNVLQKLEGIYSTYVEDQIKEEFGVEGGLAGLSKAGKDAPNTQYIPKV